MPIQYSREAFSNRLFDGEKEAYREEGGEGALPRLGIKLGLSSIGPDAGWGAPAAPAGKKSACSGQKNGTMMHSVTAEKSLAFERLIGFKDR